LSMGVGWIAPLKNWWRRSLCASVKVDQFTFGEIPQDARLDASGHGHERRMVGAEP
jgi:hypothetical protein